MGNRSISGGVPQPPTGEYVRGATVRRLTSAGDQRAAVVARDVTAREAREQALERERARLRALFDESPDGIMVHDESGEITTRAPLRSTSSADESSGECRRVRGRTSRTEPREPWSDMALGTAEDPQNYFLGKQLEKFPGLDIENAWRAHGEIRRIVVPEPLRAESARGRTRTEPRLPRTDPAHLESRRLGTRPRDRHAGVDRPDEAHPRGAARYRRTVDDAIEFYHRREADTCGVRSAGRRRRSRTTRNCARPAARRSSGYGLR
ncbi:hypothetical protein C9J85_19605 [Haloferax sp. wsp5]|nr:hypothetical protein C9J85_19605 [Haloferax sp. wsp5]